MSQPDGQTSDSSRLFRQIILLASPLILQNLSQTLLGVIDTYFVSRIGTEALAAVGLASVLYFAVLLLFRSTANSTVVFVGRAHGEKDDAKVGDVVWRALNMVGWFALPILAMPWLFTLLIGLMAPPDEPLVRELGTQYLQIVSWAILPIMFSAVVWAFLVGRGDSRTPMILAWVTVLANIFLDWVLVLGNLGAPRLGVAGAAYATVLANVLNAIISAGILWQPKHRLQFKTGKARVVAWREVWKALKIGLPLGMGDFMEIASFSLFFAFLARLGTEILAANQLALQYVSISFTLGIAIGMATSSLVAQYLGAQQPDVAEQVGYRAVLVAMVAMGLIGLGYLVAPDRLLGFFTDDPIVIEAGVTVLRLVALYQVFEAVGIVLAGALNGAGDTSFTMWTRTILAWGMFIPLSWAMIFVWDAGVWGAWVAALVYLACLAAVYLFRFRAGGWKRIELA